MKPRMRNLIIILLAFAPFAGWSQLNESVWILGGDKFLGQGFRKWKFDAVLDGRNSFDDGSPVRVGGLRLGLEFKRVHRFGIGFYGLSEIERDNFQTLDNGIVPARLKLDYSTFYYERVLYFSRRWEISGTAHLGSGQIKISYNDPKDSTLTFNEQPIDIRILETSVSAYYHITWWFSIGGGVGHRWIEDTPVELGNIYDSTVYLVKAKFRFGKMLRAIRNKQVKNEY